jgi:hypothetical protein
VLLVVDVVHDGGEDGRFDLAHLRGGVLFPGDLVEAAKTAAQGGVEVVLDVVVSPAWGKGYRPVKCREMSFQRLPCSLCNWKSRCSSYPSQGFLFTDGLRWLYHLSRHCLPVRTPRQYPSRNFYAILVQSLRPNCPTSAQIASSSCIATGVPRSSRIADSCRIFIFIHPERRREFDAESRPGSGSAREVETRLDRPLHQTTHLQPTRLHALAVKQHY